MSKRKRKELQELLLVGADVAEELGDTYVQKTLVNFAGGSSSPLYQSLSLNFFWEKQYTREGRASAAKKCTARIKKDLRQVLYLVEEARSPGFDDIFEYSRVTASDRGLQEPGLRIALLSELVTARNKRVTVRVYANPNLAWGIRVHVAYPAAIDYRSLIPPNDVVGEHFEWALNQLAED